MSNFPLSTLKEVLGGKGYIRGPFGSALRRGELLDSGIPVYEQQHAIRHSREFRFFIDDQKYEQLKRFAVLPGDLIISCSGTVGEISLIADSDPKGIISQALLILRPNRRQLLPEYLRYYLLTKGGKNSLLAASHGSVQVNIAPRNVVEGIELPVPPLSEQKAIAHILGTLDNKIELNQKTNETLEGIAKSLFKSWFVNFDPVRAKAEGRPTGLPDEISELFPDSFGESELGEIPSGWKVDSFTSQFNILGGGTPKTSIDEFWGGDLPWFSVVDAPFDSDCWVVETKKSITHRGLENCSSDLFRKGTTIISARGTVGKVCLVGAPMAMNQSCYALQSKQEQQDTYCYYSTKEIVETLKARSHGSVFSTITRDTLKGVDVCQPEKAVITAFEELSNPLLEKVKVHVDESRTLTSLRDALLPRLISGELRVPDAEKMLDEVGV